MQPGPRNATLVLKEMQPVRQEKPQYLFGSTKYSVLSPRRILRNATRVAFYGYSTTCRVVLAPVVVAAAAHAAAWPNRLLALKFITSKSRDRSLRSRQKKRMSTSRLCPVERTSLTAFLLTIMVTFLTRSSLTFAIRRCSSSTKSTSFIRRSRCNPSSISSVNTNEKIHRPNAAYPQNCQATIGASCSTVSRGGGGSEANATYHRAFIAVGSNLGDRFGNIFSGLELLESDDNVKVARTSYLRETPPMYKTDQPAFLNGMVEIQTILSPHELLRRIKSVEKELGRDLEGSERNGPRTLDLDIIMYGINDEKESVVVDTENLTIPHIGIAEREFVLSPLCDLDRDVVHPVKNASMNELLSNLIKEQEATNQNDESQMPEAVRVIPLPRGRMLTFNETIVMGILNVTPDSFSDGGSLKGSSDVAAEQALQMVKDGAGIIDIGGESTRPGAEEVAIKEELQRTIPVIQKIRQVSDVPISIDTRHSAVAKAAIEAGADIVNDVSGGTYDPDMLGTVAELGIPMVLMHMRGTPKTMQSMTEYQDVVSEVASTLLERSLDAEGAGIPRWMQILDPGIGFAKDFDGNLQLLKHSGKLRKLVGDFPILLGPSRKGFIGKITGETIPAERDFGSAAACLAGLCGDDNSKGYTILRVHNVRGIKQAAQVMDAVQRQK